LVLLERHVEITPRETLLFPSLKQYVGGTEGPPSRLLRKIPVPPPPTFLQLNPEQQQVAHPLSLRTALEVAGPPGTGKSKTITELVRSVIACTDFDIIVLSERNGAIEAIADKLCSNCIQLNEDGPTVKDSELWKTVLACGSLSMGPSTKLFTLEEKQR
jgi:hypothetical protein